MFCMYVHTHVYTNEMYSFLCIALQVIKTIYNVQLNLHSSTLTLIAK